MARKAGQGKEEEESRARQQEEKTPVRDEEKKPACHGGAHHVVEQGFPLADRHIQASAADYNLLQMTGSSEIAEGYCGSVQPM
ncbi:hypothetical protein STEG23_018684 [Scotinomys teguina]